MLCLHAVEFYSDRECTIPLTASGTVSVSSERSDHGASNLQTTLTGSCPGGVCAAGGGTPWCSANLAAATRYGAWAEVTYNEPQMVKCAIAQYSTYLPIIWSTNQFVLMALSGGVMVDVSGPTVPCTPGTSTDSSAPCSEGSEPGAGRAMWVGGPPSPPPPYPPNYLLTLGSGLTAPSQCTGMTTFGILPGCHVSWTQQIYADWWCAYMGAGAANGWQLDTSSSRIDVCKIDNGAQDMGGSDYDNHIGVFPSTSVPIRTTSTECAHVSTGCWCLTNLQCLPSV